MLASKQLKCVAAVAAAVTTAIGASVALASPPMNWSGEGLVAGQFNETVRINSERIKFQTKGPTDTYEVKLTWGPGGSSGWHHHPGMVLVQVASGLVDVTRVQYGRCVTTQYGVGSPNGSTFTEGDTLHEGHSAAGAVAYATAIVEDGGQVRIEDAVPSCASDFGIRKPKIPVRH